MANNYNTLIENDASKKFFLVRVEPARDISNELSLVSGTIYTANLDLPNISQINVEGDTTGFTKVTGTPSAYEFSYSDGTLLLNPGSALTDEIVIANYYLFYTDNNVTYAKENPYNATGDLVKWDARIDSSPRLAITQENVFFGVVEVSNDNISIINLDNELNKYFGDNDSWSQKKIIVWHCINSTENISPFYKGIISDISLGKSLNISVDNIFSGLNNNFITKRVTSSSDYNPEDIGKIYPIVFQKVSPYKVKNIDSEKYIASALTIDGNTMIGPTTVSDDHILEAYCSNYLNTTTPFTNWDCDIKRPSMSTLADEEVADTVIGIRQKLGPFDVPYIDQFYLEVSDINLYSEGDNFLIDDGSGNVAVCCVDKYFTDFGQANSNEIFISYMSVYSGTISDFYTTFGAGDDIRIPHIPFVAVYDNESYQNYEDGVYLPLTYDRDYKVVKVGTGLNSYYQVQIQSGFESNYGVFPRGGGAINNYQAIEGGVNSKWKLYYRVKQDFKLNHSEVIKEIIDNYSLLETESTSFTLEQSRDIECNFTYPAVGSKSFLNFRELLQEVLPCTLGLIYLDDDFKINYGHIDSVGTGEAITENYILKNSYTNFISYKDIKSKLVARNDNGFVGQPQLDINTGEVTLSSTVGETPYAMPKSTLLHGTDKEKNINLVISLDSFETYAVPVLKKIYGERTLIVSLETNIEYVNLNINDDVTVTFSETIGESTTRNYTIIGIEKQKNKVKLKLIDFLNI